MSAARPPPLWDAVAARMRPFVRSRVASDADTDDVLQEVLLRVHRGLPEIEDPERFGAWLFRVARSALADHHRARARHPVAAADEDRELPAAPVDGEESLVAEQLARTLASFVAALPSPYREAITLTELEGRTQREAAEMLGVSLSALKSRVLRGRQKLRAVLHACCAIALDARGKVVACEPRPDGRVPDGCCA